MNHVLNEFTAENEKEIKEKKLGGKLNIAKAVRIDMVNNFNKNEKTQELENKLKNLEKKAISNQTINFTNTNQTTKNEIRNFQGNIYSESVSNNENDNKYYVNINKNPIISLIKNDFNVICHEHKINFLLKTEEKAKYFENNIPNNFFFENNEISDQIAIKQFNQFYYLLCKFMGNLMNFNFNIIENNVNEFLCEFKVFSETKKENNLHFQLKFYKSVDIEYFDYVPILNTIKEHYILSKELEILKEDFGIFLEKIFEFRMN